MIEIRARLEFQDGMSTETIDALLLQSMVSLIDESENPEINNVNYQYVAGRQRVSMLRKEVYGEYDPPKLYDIVKKNIDAGMYTRELLDWYTEDEWNIIDLFIDHAKDEEYISGDVERITYHNPENGFAVLNNLFSMVFIWANFIIHLSFNLLYSDFLLFTDTVLVSDYESYCIY
jgi:ribonucleoside-diphosphate reductase alpha chain